MRRVRIAWFTADGRRYLGPVVGSRWTDACTHIATFPRYDWWAELVAGPTGLCLAFISVPVRDPWSCVSPVVG